MHRTSPLNTGFGNGRNTSRSFERHEHRQDMPHAEVAKHTRKTALPLPETLSDDCLSLGDIPFWARED